VLNTFAYTCGFSTCAAQAGARTTNIDLSGKYLDWGRRNFALNRLDAAAHLFLRGDVLDWLARLARKRRAFDVVLLDPPTFSRSKQSGTFQAERDYPKLVRAALAVLRPGGLLFASTNAHGWNRKGSWTKSGTPPWQAAGRSASSTTPLNPPTFPSPATNPPT